jgi:PAS domain S-box-containing protein
VTSPRRPQDLGPHVTSTSQGASQHNRAEGFAQRFDDIRANQSSSLDVTDSYEHELSYLLDAAVPDFCDWCEINVLESNGASHRYARARNSSGARENDSGSDQATIDRRVPDLEDIQRRVLNSQQLETWPETNATELPYCVVVGLRVNGLPFGTTTFVVDDKHHGFTPTDIAQAQKVSSSLASAIERSLLHGEARDAARRTQHIASQLHQLLAASIAVAGLHNEHDVLRRLAQSSRNVFDADRAIVSLERGLLAPLYGIAERNKSAFNAGPGDGSKFIDVPRFREDEFTPWTDRAWCVAPLLSGRTQSRGFIAVERDDGTDFSAEEREVLTLLAQMSSTALGALELSRNIQRSETRWRVLVETAPVGIIEVDFEGNVRWWNRAASRIFSWPVFAEPVDSFDIALPPTVKDRFVELWSEAQKGAIEGSRDFEDVQINGRWRHLNVSAVLLPSAGDESRSLLTLIDDVTNQRELRQEVRHAHQMELRGQVASSIAHDFNNLLTLISGYAEILSQDLAGKDRELEMVRNIQSTASRASHLTGQLQAIGRTQSIVPVVLNPVDVMRSTAEVLERIVGADIKLRWSLDSKVANVKVEADQFEQMILNLTINARDAMPTGGTLMITVHDTSLDADQAPQLDLPEGDYVEIMVADTGVGMDEETLRQCFNPLFTTKGPFKGTGMGLAAARRLVEDSGGAIRVTSTPHEGTTFDVLLPAVRQDVVASAKQDDVERPKGSANVLVVEDDDGLRKLITQVLGRNGYTVVEADSGERALELVHTRETTFDLLISDVVMDAVSGPDLARELQSGDPSLRVLLISGTADDSVLNELNPDTAVFLAKPFKPSELIDQVHDLLERRNS